MVLSAMGMDTRRLWACGASCFLLVTCSACGADTADSSQSVSQIFSSSPSAASNTDSPTGASMPQGSNDGVQAGMSRQSDGQSTQPRSSQPGQGIVEVPSVPHGFAELTSQDKAFFHDLQKKGIDLEKITGQIHSHTGQDFSVQRTFQAHLKNIASLACESDPARQNLAITLTNGVAGQLLENKAFSGNPADAAKTILSTAKEHYCSPQT